MTPRGAVKRHAENLEWCPEEYRAEYLRLERRRDFDAAEARRIIEDHIAAVKRRANSSTREPGRATVPVGIA